ncbi:MAG: DUF5989 family protein [Candidatus Nanohaloarchaea archaeon]
MSDLKEILYDFYRFVRENKKYWLIPVLAALLAFGFLLATAGTAPVPVFVYPVA